MFLTTSNFCDACLTWRRDQKSAVLRSASKRCWSRGKISNIDSYPYRAHPCEAERALFGPLLAELEDRGVACQWMKRVAPTQ